MLDNNDRQQIIAIIQQTIASSLGSSKQSNKFQGTTYSKYGKASQKDWERQQREKEKKDRIAELEDKRRKGKDSLAQRLELAKLRSEEKLFGNISPEVKDLLKGTAKTAGKVAGGVATGVTAGALGTASAVRNSKLGSSLVSSMMMSNPLTAILYMNSDLISGTARGVGKIGKALGKGALGTAGVLGKGLFSGASWIYSKLRKGSGDDDDTTTGTSLIPGQPKRTIRTGKANVMASTNYIMAKNAMLIGGKNYFYISLGGGFTGGLGGAMGNISRGVGAIAGATAGALSGTFTPLLPGPSDGTQPSFAGGGRRMRNVTPKDDTTKSIVKGITGMHEQAKKSNELQKEANKKVMLIAGITLLAVAGIALLAKYLMDKKDFKPFGSISKVFNQKVTSGIETTNLDQISNDLIKKQVLGKASLIDNKGTSFSLGSSAKESKNTLKKLQDNKIITEAERKQIEKEKGTELKNLQFSVFHTKDKEKTVLGFPVDIIVIDDKINTDNTRTITIRKKNAGFGNVTTRKTLVITKVVSKIGYIKAGATISKDNIVPANTPLCIVEDGFTITGDLKDFLNNYDSLETYINENIKDNKKWADTLDKQRTDEFIKKQVKQNQKEVTTSQARADVTAQSLADMYKTVTTSSFEKRVEDLKDLPENVGNLLGLAANVEVRPSKNISTLLNGVKRRKTPVIQSSGQGYTGELPDLKTSTINVPTPDTIFYSLPIEDTMKANAGLLGIQQ